MANIRSYRDLRVYQAAFEAAMHLFEISRGFPPDERYSLSDQLRRSSRSVCANLAEAWRRRRYEAHFVSKLNDCETEAEETRVWIEFARRCGYISKEIAESTDQTYDSILSQLVKMANEPQHWIIR